MPIDFTEVLPDGTMSPGSPEAEPGKTLDDFFEIKTNHKMLGSDPTVTTVRLTGGGLIQARDVSLEGTVLLTATDVGDFNILMSDVQSIVYQAKQASKERDSLIRKPATDVDRVLVLTSKGPRTISGLLEGISEKSIQIDYLDRVRNIDIQKIVGVFPARISDAKLPKYRLHLIDHCILLADSLQYDGKYWKFQRGDQQGKVDGTSVVKIQVQSDRVAFLSDLKMDLDQVETMIAPPTQTKISKCVSGGPLRLQIVQDGKKVNRVFTKGLGTHASSRIVFTLPTGYNKLLGHVGIDLGTRGNGNCTCSILADGIEVFRSPLSGKTAAVEIQVDVQAVKKLELIVEAGPMLDLGDWVNWADIRIIKTE